MVLNFERIRLNKQKGLILFFIVVGTLALSMVLQSCSSKKERALNIEIIWTDDRATGLIIPSVYVNDIPSDSIVSQLHVYLPVNESRTAIFGEYKTVDDGIEFRPLIPFTPGLTYEINVAGKKIGNIQIPRPDDNDVPQVAGLFPSADTLPENLLKIYLKFSHPMREGQALKYITLLKNGVDTVRGTFLDLQPELWNQDYTMLTLWLDPGRIKRDLQPNQRLGIPLVQGNSYTLIVNQGWPDTRGSDIKNEFRKSFFVGERDGAKPNIDGWTLTIPKQATKEPLIISLNEPLDGVLLSNTIKVISGGGNTIEAEIEVLNEERIVRMTPSSEWNKGSYTLQVEGRLEDLAGNNLNRLFDRDITKDGEFQNKEFVTRTFEIQ